MCCILENFLPEINNISLPHFQTKSSNFHKVAVVVIQLDVESTLRAPANSISVSFLACNISFGFGSCKWASYSFLKTEIYTFDYTEKINQLKWQVNVYNFQSYPNHYTFPSTNYKILPWPPSTVYGQLQEKTWSLITFSHNRTQYSAACNHAHDNTTGHCNVL